ncbi:tRNA preQ1(34) S-adenosylmethionine ribosyltransferase-isomerase QueA [Helicobacter sp. MIT 00-7814]|uniref:tRNA preQ1(34) S-adenosylmethionine ribosyltransferase-isomerase QueA n=1 Tax=unclassified Helicobacter TaxID=2593540 RepID=UPI000E1F353E|nr:MULTISPECIES: tRNA preQ1(34) S-adenosylmethionine ribosyltransferase-isomerase QueA [unclassified Helicobacter]RDU55232.1 tRNA preQ1(34) S-adenosylmethionine ribosyltransferase-isomerase QueA [Helicobacter sp. MIT 99-10781]RDU56070.1 tRNA preQ1(34) S-adenosylmethionine ribosyltransferase-isomerase QueA [Helicobacter sp. MIT 00-7814]
MQAPTRKDFFLQSYDYDLPKELIAYAPTTPRSAGKLLVYKRAQKSIEHVHFSDFCDIIPRESILVCNDTKVLKARLFGRKISGDYQNADSKLYEIFFHKPLESGGCEKLDSKKLDSNKLDSQISTNKSSAPDKSTPRFLVQIRGKVKCGDCIVLDSGVEVRICEILSNGLRVVEFQDSNGGILDFSKVLQLLENHGAMPLPPYIKREANAQDEHDYQSVFAKHAGAVAAPTASLHFSAEDFSALQKRFQTCFVTLHVGAGTFQGVESEDIRAHTMHSESFFIPPQSEAILQKHFNDGALLCIGTTAARVVETYAREGKNSGECELFLHPHNPPRAKFGLLTNFHLPKSTLLMLTSALIGRTETLRVYEEAKKAGYKFYSFGDGMLIL